MKTGRPSVPVTWPDGNFTVADVKAKYNLSRVCIQEKINKAIEANELTELGKVEGKVGRPRRIYTKALAQVSTPAPAPAVPAVEKPVDF